MCKKARAVREDSPCLLCPAVFLFRTADKKSGRECQSLPDFFRIAEMSVLCILLVPFGVHEVVLCDFDINLACLGGVYHLDELCRSAAP